MILFSLFLSLQPPSAVGKGTILSLPAFLLAYISSQFPFGSSFWVGGRLRGPRYSSFLLDARCSLPDAVVRIGKNRRANFVLKQVKKFGGRNFQLLHSGIADCIVLRYPINRCKYMRQEPLKLRGLHVRRHGSKEAQNGQGSQRPGCLIRGITAVPPRDVG